MRPYGQFCALARALDVIGDRWTLLIVRELTTGPSRYSDLRDGLPGIATNLLADRLRHLDAEGIVAHDESTATYRLTERGEALAPVLRELVRWGAPLMTTGSGGDEFRAHWLPLALEALFEGATIDRAVSVAFAVPDGEAVVVSLDGEGVAVDVGAPAHKPDAVVAGAPDAVIAVLAGILPVRDAEGAGLDISGSKAAVRRLLSAVPTPARHAS